VHLNKTSWYLSFKKGSRDLLATWKEAISQKNCDKISKERRVFESGSPTILGTKPWVLREIGREIRSPLSQRKTKAINRIYKPHIYMRTSFFTNDFTLGALKLAFPLSPYPSHRHRLFRLPFMQLTYMRLCCSLSRDPFFSSSLIKTYQRDKANSDFT